MLELYEPGSEAEWLRSFRFALELRPRFCETDALGHVSNTVYTAYWEQARLRYFETIGEADDAPKRILAFNHMAVEIATRMLKPCFYDEELLLHARDRRAGPQQRDVRARADVRAGTTTVRAIARIAVVASPTTSARCRGRPASAPSSRRSKAAPSERWAFSPGRLDA